MGVYATVQQVRDYLADDTDAGLPADDDAVEALIARAERRVDLVLGPHPIVEATGLKVDPATLTGSQADALARAVGASVEHELLVGLEFLAGSDDYLSGEITVLRQPLRQSPRVLEELAGHGLLTRSGVAAPTPVPTPAPPDDWGWWGI